MIVAGIDIGSRAAKAVLMKDAEIVVTWGPISDGEKEVADIGILPPEVLEPENVWPGSVLDVLRPGAEGSFGFTALPIAIDPWIMAYTLYGHAPTARRT